MKEPTPAQKVARFSSTNQPENHNPKGQGPYLTPLLKRFLNKKISFEDPETQKMIKGKVKDAVIWRLILNATQGENLAIKEILDRVDGKVAQELKGEGFGGDTKIYIISNKEANAGVKGNANRLPDEISI